MADTAEGPVFTGRAAWDGEADLDIHDAVAADSEHMETRTTTAECVEWLQDFLTANERPRGQVAAAAKAAGFSESTLKRAARKLGVVRETRGYPRTAHWSLPIVPADERSSVRRSSAGESVLNEPTGLTEGGDATRVSEVSEEALQNADPTGDPVAIVAGRFDEATGGGD